MEKRKEKRTNIIWGIFAYAFMAVWTSTLSGLGLFLTTKSIAEAFFLSSLTTIALTAQFLELLSLRNVLDRRK
jgi:hypothetical protein